MYMSDADSVVKTFLTTECHVTRLERDKFVPNNIIISDYTVSEKWEMGAQHDCTSTRWNKERAIPCVSTGWGRLPSH